MYYSVDPGMCRVDFFKLTGRWECTEAVRWVGHADFNESFRLSLEQHLAGRMEGMIAVCMEPYHELKNPHMRFLHWEGPTLVLEPVRTFGGLNKEDKAFLHQLAGLAAAGLRSSSAVTNMAALREWLNFKLSKDE